MSHSMRELMGMTNRQLENIASHSEWSFERDRARQILAERRAADEKKAQAFSDRQQTLIDNLRVHVASLQKTNAALAAQVQQATNHISSLSKQQAQTIKDMQHKFDQKLLAQEAQHQKDNAHNMQLVTQLIKDTKADFDAEIKASNKNLQDQIDTIGINVTALHNSITEVINANHSIVLQQTSMLQEAQNYLIAARGVLQEVDLFNVHGWRAADRAALSIKENNTQASIAAGPIAAAVALNNGRELFQETLIFQEKVLEDERRWQRLFATAGEALAQAEAYLEVNRKVTVDTEEDDVTIQTEEVDVDYWSNGDLSRIKNGLADIRARMDDPKLTEAQLNALQELALTYRAQVTEAVNYAMQAHEMGRRRTEIMGVLIDDLTDPETGAHLIPGWKENYSNYHNDPRLGCRAFLRDATDPNGAQIVITIEPVNLPGKPPCNAIRSEILHHGSQIKDKQQADDFNRNLMTFLQNAAKDDDGNLSMVFSGPECTHQDALVPDVGQADQASWLKPSKEDADEVLSHVGCQHSADSTKQVTDLRTAAALPV